MHKTDNSEWITHNNPDIVPLSTIQGYIQKGFFYKCLLKNISKDLDDFGLLYQPVRSALATRVQMSNLPPLLLPVIAGEYVQARISYVADFDRLFVQLENNARTIINIGKRLRDLTKQRHMQYSEPLCNPECGTIVAALYTIDRCYYRASVCSKNGIDSIVVLYIDYGNMASVNINDAFLLKDAYLLSVPPQAVQLIIEDVRKPRLTSEQIRNLLTDQTIAARINDVSENGESFIANLFVKDEKYRTVNLMEVILGERPAPTLPVPKPAIIDSFLDNESELVDCTCREFPMQNCKGCSHVSYTKSCKRQLFAGGGWNRISESNCKTDGLRKQNRSGSFSINFRVCHNCGESGHLAPQCPIYRRSGFAKDKSSDDSRRQRFVGNGCFTGSSYTSINGIKGRNGNRSSGRKNQSPRLFLDRDTHHGDTAIGKSGWKSGNWTTENAAESENSGFEKKMDKKKDTENWIVNEGMWEVNNGDNRNQVEAFEACEPTDNRNQVETFERTSRNLIAPLAHSNFDGVGNRINAESCTESIEASENLLINAFDVSLPPDSEVDSGGANGTKTTNGGLSNYGTSNEPNNDLLSLSTLNRIESASLEEIKFGDTVGGLRSDGSAEADPLSFFVQLDRDKNNIEHLILSDAQLPANLPKLFSFEISQACVALFMGYYYRAEIISEENSIKKRILFVDYGNVEVVETSILYVIDKSLPDQFYSSRRLALHCRLHGIMPVASKHSFDPEARKVFSELTANEKLFICFLQQSVKGIYEVTIMLSNGHFVSDILISRGFAVPFKWGIGPSLPLYETLDVLRSDEFDHVHPVFTVQLSDSLAQLERLNNGYVDNKKVVEVPQIGDVVISYFEESPYRAEIIAMEIDGDSIAYRVCYVDYGNESLCAKEELFELDRDQQPDEILYTPRQSFRCRIDGVRPLNHKEEWPEEVQKFIDSLLAPSTSFEATVGSPSTDGVYPIRIMVLKNQLNEKDGLGADEINNINDKVELANWLIASGYAEMRDIWRDYPVKNLLADGEHEYEMFITEVDGQIIHARPYIFAEQYNKMKKALANIETVPLATGATTGLISLNNENKRAVLVSSANDATPKKCLLVDEGISVEEIPSQFFGIGELCDSDGFLVRTCHRLSVRLRFTELLLNEKLKETIMNSAADDAVKVILVKYNEDSSYLISDILFSDGTALMEKLKKARQDRIDGKESAQDFDVSDLKQASSRSSNQDEKAVDLNPLNNGMKQIECSENLITNQVPDLKPQASEISNGIFGDMNKDCRTFDPEIIAVLDSLVAGVSKFDEVQ